MAAFSLTDEPLVERDVDLRAWWNWPVENYGHRRRWCEWPFRRKALWWASVVLGNSVRAIQPTESWLMETKKRATNPLQEAWIFNVPPQMWSRDRRFDFALFLVRSLENQPLNFFCLSWSQRRIVDASSWVVSPPCQSLARLSSICGPPHFHLLDLRPPDRSLLSSLSLSLLVRVQATSKQVA